MPRPPQITRESSPCKDCPERFIACSDRCPKDERGEYGYKAFKASNEKVKEARRNYSMKYDKYFHDYREDTNGKA
jgi:hypothetical protein